MKKLIVIIAILFMGTFALYVLFDRGMIWFVYPDHNRFPVRGIDVSYHKGAIDWKKVRGENIQFVFLKATEGDDFKDRMFQDNWNNARAQNIAVGAYHFYSLRFPGDVQAKNFIDTTPVASGSLPPVIDLEYGGNSIVRPTRGDFQKELATYITLVREHYGQEPILYVTYEFYRDYLYPEFKNSPLWVRDLFREPTADNVQSWRFWQYKNRGHIDGIDGYVDLNVFRGSSDELEILRKSESLDNP